MISYNYPISIVKHCWQILTVFNIQGEKWWKKTFLKPNFKGKLWNNSCDTGKACIELWNKIHMILRLKLFYIPCFWSTQSVGKLEKWLNTISNCFAWPLLEGRSIASDDSSQAYGTEFCHSLLNVTSKSRLHGYLARALVLTDILPPFFLGRMDGGSIYWWRRTTFWKIYTCFYIFKFPPNITCFDRLVPL